MADAEETRGSARDQDRVVLVGMPDGSEVVRYRGAAVYAREWPLARLVSMDTLNLRRAVRYAVEAHDDERGSVHLGQSGATRFDAAFRTAVDAPRD